MSRSRTTDEDTVLASRSRKVSPVRVEVMDSSSVWRDLTNLSGTGFSGLDFFKAASITDNVDAPTWTGSVTLAEQQFAADGTPIFLAPDMATSPVNSPDPLLDGMVRIQMFATTALIDGTLASEHRMFDGYIVDIEQEGEISLSIADLGHRLLIKQIEDERVYGSDAGEFLEDVIQQILDDNMGTGAYTLAVEPALAGTVKLKKFALDRDHLLDAIRNLAINTVGANVRFMWRDDDTMELRLFMPPRSKTVADFSFSADNYYPTPRWRRNTSDIRNKGRLYFQNASNKAVSFVSGKVQASIDRYFDRYFEFREAAVKNIDTEPEAQAMLDAALADLSTPKAEKSFTTPFAWPFQIHDLFTMAANGRQYSTDQDQFVTSVTHTFGDAKSTRTQFETRGTIAGFYNNWLIQEGEGPRPPNVDSLCLSLGAGGEATMYGGERFNNKTNGCVWPLFYLGKNIRRLHVWARANAPGTLVPEWPPTGSDIYKAGTIERPEGKLPRDGNFVWPGPATPDPTDPYNGISFYRIYVPIPTGEEGDGDVIRTIVVKAETVDGTFGPEQRIIATAAQSSEDDPGGFASISVTRISATTVRVQWLRQLGVSAAVLIMRDGVNIDQVLDPDASATLTWYDEELHADKTYEYSVFCLRNNQSGERYRKTIDPWGTAFGFASGTPTLVETVAGPRVRIDITGIPTGTVTVLVQKSVDSGQYDPWTTSAVVPVANFPYDDVIVRAGQYYRLVALDGSDTVLDTSLPFFWTPPIIFRLS